jgi:hypothetical protein
MFSTPAEEDESEHTLSDYHDTETSTTSTEDLDLARNLVDAVNNSMSVDDLTDRLDYFLDQRDGEFSVNPFSVVNGLNLVLKTSYEILK